MKYIPPEVIVAYTSTEGSDQHFPTTRQDHGMIVFAIILGATPVYLVRFANVRKPLQVLISTVAFVIWAFAYPTPPFQGLTRPLSSTVLLALYTFLNPLLTVT